MSAIESTVEHRLPREAYFSQEWHDREQIELFGRCWHFAGMTDDYDGPGSYRAVQVGPHPLLVVRGSDGELRAHHNLCRHRGAQVLQGAGKIRKSIICPYHRWAYGVDGCLLHIPQRQEFDPGVDESALSLRRAALDTFKGMVFVHPDPHPEPLADWLGDFPEHHGPFDPEQLVEVIDEVHELNCNWKTYLENHQDGYHLGYVHAESLGGYAHREQRHYLYGRHWSFHEPIEAGVDDPPDRAATNMPLIPELDRHWQGSSVHVLFPNFAVSGGATFWCSLEVQPLTPETCRLHLRARGVAAAAEAPRLVKLTREAVRRAQAAAGAAHRQVRARRFAPGAVVAAAAAKPEKPLGVLEEDAYCCEAIQTGLRSPNFEIGPIAPRYEQSIIAFQQNVLDYVPIRRP
jgi:phenylpropionate dioxygenase-like ring-hydroxylating dioxygenase large terminal subunit